MRIGFFWVTRFRDRDLNVADVAPIPARLKQRIGEAKCQDILHRLFTQVVVDAVDLRFREKTDQRSVQCTRQLQVLAKRFFEHDPRPPAIVRYPDALQLLGDGFHHRWGRGEIEDLIGWLPPFFLTGCDSVRQQAKSFRIGEVRHDVGQARREAGPVLACNLALSGETVNALVQVLAKHLIVLLHPVKANDQKLLRQPAV